MQELQAADLALQSTFEKLLKEYESNGHNPVREALPDLQDRRLGVMQQSLLVEKYIEGWWPSIGARITTPERGAVYEYLAKFTTGNPKEFGRIKCGSLEFHVENSHQDIRAGAMFFGGWVHELAERFDRPILQAAANVYQERVLHTLLLNLEQSERLALLIANGYAMRGNDPRVLDKVFYPISDPASREVPSSHLLMES